MKTRRVLIAFVLIMVFLTGCGKKAELAPPVETNGQDAVAETEPEAEETQAPEQNTKAIEDEFVISGVGDGTCQIDVCLSEKTVIEIPEKIADQTVVGIGDGAFGNSPAQKIIIPDTVEYVDAYAFSICENLQEVQFGAGVKWTGDHLFNDCPQLQRVSFPEGMQEMKGIAFFNCGSLGEVYIPDSVTEIPRGITYLDFCPNIVIVTPAGSAAETSATEFELPVKNS